jgi:hypothetical protein
VALGEINVISMFTGRWQNSAMRLDNRETSILQMGVVSKNCGTMAKQQAVLFLHI